MALKWVRSRDGALCGVCKGIAKALGLPVGIVRLLWLLSLLFLGAGALLYLMFAVSLPREDKIVEALEPKILGVCSRIALRTELEVGVVRFLAICLALLSLGATIVGYIVLYFILDNPTSGYNSDNNPSVPRSTM